MPPYNTSAPEEVIAIRTTIEKVIASLPPSLSLDHSSFSEKTIPSLESEDDQVTVSEELVPYLAHPGDNFLRRRLIKNAISEIEWIRERARRRGKLTAFDHHLKEVIASSKLPSEFVEAMTNLLNQSEPTP